MNLKHNKYMNQWAKRLLIIICLAISLGVFYTSTVFAVGGGDSGGEVKAYQEYNKCLKQAYRDDPLVNQETLAAKCGGQSLPTKCSVEGPVGWMMCPLVSLVGWATDNSYAFVQGLMEIDVKFLNFNSPSHQAWMQIRNIANVVLVIVFLVIIVSQLTGFGLSNYSAKKLLPKLLMAIILVNASFIISQILVDISNIAGSSIVKLFGDFGKTLFTQQGPLTPDEAALGVVGLGTSILLGIMALKIIPLVYSTFALVFPMFISFIMVIVTTGIALVIREAAAIALVVMSPLAFASLILPKTESLFNFWKRAMTGILIAFPIVGLLFGAAGFVSGLITSSSGSFMLQALGLIIAGVPMVFAPGLIKNSIAALPAVGAMAGNFLNRIQTGAANKARNSRPVKLAERQHQQRFNTMLTTGQAMGKGKFNQLVAKGASSLAHRTKSGRSMLHEINTQQAKSIGDLADQINDQDLAAILGRDENGNMGGFNFEALSDQTKRAMIANGYDANNAGELVSAATIRQSKLGNLNSQDHLDAMSYANKKGVSSTALQRTSEKVRQNSLDKGRYDLAATVTQMQKNGGFSASNIASQLASDPNWYQKAFQKHSESLSADKIAAISPKALASSDYAAVFKDLYTTNGHFKYNVDASINDPNMSTETYNAIDNLIKRNP